MNVPRGSFEAEFAANGTCPGPSQTDRGGQLAEPMRLWVEPAEHLPHIRGNASEIAVLGVREHVEHRLDVIVVDDHWRVVALDAGEIAQQLRLPSQRPTTSVFSSALSVSISYCGVCTAT